MLAQPAPNEALFFYKTLGLPSWELAHLANRYIQIRSPPLPGMLNLSPKHCRQIALALTPMRMGPPLYCSERYAWCKIAQAPSFSALLLITA